MEEFNNFTAEQKALVKSSLQKLQPLWAEAVSLFYVKLFELDPTLKNLFNLSIAEQERKFADMLQITVYSLDQPDRLGLAVKQLGARHKAYGVKPTDYATVEMALIWTLEQGLEESFTPAMKAAWQALYTLLVRLMNQD